MSKAITGSKLKLALENLDSLPVMPAVAQKLLALRLNTEAGEASMLKLIEQDALLSARIIGLANSPLLGVGRKINSINDAAMLLGLERLKSVSLGVATLSRLMDRPASKNFDPHDLWTHSMTIAIVMKTVAQAMPARIRPDDDRIFLAGLLHDIGLMALHYLDPDASDELHRCMRLQPRIPINELELELLGMTHSQIGAKLVRHWHLPADIVAVVECHHSPATGAEAYANPLVRLVNIAEKLLPDFGVAEHTFDAIEDSEWSELCIDSLRATEFFELANELALQVVQLPDAHEPPADTAEDVKSPPERPLPPLPPAVKDSIPLSLLGRLFAWIGRLLR